MMVRIPRIADVLDTTFLQENLQFLDPIVYRILRLKTEGRDRLLAVHTIVSSILKFHLCPLDHHVRKMITNLVCKIDDTHVLSVKIKDTIMLGFQVVDDGLGRVLYMQQRT